MTVTIHTLYHFLSTRIHIPSQWCLLSCIRVRDATHATSSGVRAVHSRHACPLPSGRNTCSFPLRYRARNPPQQKDPEGYRDSQQEHSSLSHLTSCVATRKTLSPLFHRTGLSRTREVGSHLSVWKTPVVKVWPWPKRCGKINHDA